MRNKNIVVLTGAGISAESGIRTFRDQNGLWENHRVEDVASIEGFHRNPGLVQSFYNQRRLQLKDPKIKPNTAHLSLASLEENWDGSYLLITQNVDNLHERAGSKKVLHMHGELLKARCTQTEDVFEWEEPILAESTCPCCNRKGTLRPHIVWFGEVPLNMEIIFLALQKCDLFISIGTSGLVYPAAGFVEAVSPNAKTIEINVEPSATSNRFQEQRIGHATFHVRKLVEEILSRTSI
jgi:NAD-dependent deacetylase